MHVCTLLGRSVVRGKWLGSRGAGDLLKHRAGVSKKGRDLDPNGGARWARTLKERRVLLSP